MFYQLLEKILTDHPLIGVERDDYEKGQLSGVEAPAWINEGPVYEIFPRNFSTGGTFRDIQNRLSDLKELGVKTIWLMPFHPIGKKGKKGAMGSPYAIRDYLAIDKSHGTEKDLKELITRIHDLDMKVIMDVVASHTALDHVWRSEHLTVYREYLSIEQTRRISEWTDIADLNYQNPDLNHMMSSVLRYWINAFDFDGFRCDVAGFIPLEFWQGTFEKLRKIKKDLFFLAEWESARLHLDVFHATYDWTTYFVLKDIYEGKRPASDALQWVIEKTDQYPQKSLTLRFTENHDFERTTKTFGNKSFYPFVVFNFVLSGIPLLYHGQEGGQDKAVSLFDKDPVDWNKNSDIIYQFYKRLIHIRNENRSLVSGELQVIGNDQQSKVVSFIKKTESEKIFVLLNFSDQFCEVKPDWPENSVSIEKASDLYNDSYVKGEDLRVIKMNPYGFHIIKQT
jgi:glycosidase